MIQIILLRPSHDGKPRVARGLRIIAADGAYGVVYLREGDEAGARDGGRRPRADPAPQGAGQGLGRLPRGPGWRSPRTAGALPQAPEKPRRPRPRTARSAAAWRPWSTSTSSSSAARAAWPRTRTRPGRSTISPPARSSWRSTRTSSCRRPASSSPSSPWPTCTRSSRAAGLRRRAPAAAWSA